MTIKERYGKVISWFQQHMPVAETELHYSDPFSLLVSVILSAQCTDKRVNMITPALMARYPAPADMANAKKDEILSFIRTCSYPNSKANYLIAMSKKLVDHYNSTVPESVEDLMTLPGVGRKTANVITLVAYGNPAMPVDTHVFRVAARLGLTTDARNPEETEKQLIKNLPPETLAKAHHWLILHGRYICMARKPKCPECGLKEWCRYYNLLKNKTK